MVCGQNLHLAASVIIIVPIALAYGALPNIVLPELFDFAVSATRLKGIVIRDETGLTNSEELSDIQEVFVKMR